MERPSLILGSRRRERGSTITIECYHFAYAYALHVFSNCSSECHSAVVDPNPALVKFKYRMIPSFGNCSKPTNQPRGVSPMLFLQCDEISVGAWSEKCWIDYLSTVTQGGYTTLGKLNGPRFSFLPVGPSAFWKRRNIDVCLGVDRDLYFPSSVIVQELIELRTYLEIYCTGLKRRRLSNEQCSEAPVEGHKWRP